MKIDKATDTLYRFLRFDPNQTAADVEAAIKLGIEALKGIKKVRKTFRPYVEALLPGETED